MKRKFIALLCILTLAIGLFACGVSLDETVDSAKGSRATVGDLPAEQDASTAPTETACKHSWVPADCFTAKTCALCGETEGEAAGHRWQDANCLAPKTCSICGATEGTLGKHHWQVATCISPKTCEVCNFTDGQLGDHAWIDASCTAPKTCTVCKLTEGEPTEHLWENATCELPQTCTSCNTTQGEALGHDWKDADCTAPKTCARCGLTEGSPSHNYVNGYCTRCNKADPDATFVWIPTNGGTRYHCKSSCSGMIDPEMVTVEEAVARGFTPCGRCY